jgi:hypothetical protein
MTLICDKPSVEDGFGVYEHNFCGIPSYLIIPAIDAKWNKTNLHYRSLIISKETSEILSSGWPKFFNCGEKPDCYPDPNKYDDWNIQEKLDGSLLIVDYVNGKFNMRTRGTPSYINQNNFKDFELLKEYHPDIVSYLEENNHLSLLLEIVTPNNIIVIRTPMVRFYLLGAIDKTNLKPLPIKKVEDISQDLKIPMPEVYSFDNLEETIKTVKEWKGKEGIVISYNNNQNRIKIKSDWYCWIHKIKSKLNSESNLIEFYVNEGLPSYKKFYNIIKNNFDWELAEQMKNEISRMVDCGKKVKKIITGMYGFIDTIKHYSTRKEQAQQIISSYGGGQNNRESMLFNLLDGKDLSKDQLMKLMHQNL